MTDDDDDDDLPSAGDLEPEGLVVPPAGARVMSSLIDAFVAAVLVLLLGITVTQAVFRPVAGAKLTAGQAWTVTIVAYAGVALVFVLVHRLADASLGNRVTRIRLVDRDGARPSWGRLLAKYVLVFALASYGYLGPLLVLVCLVLAVAQKDRRNVFDQVTGLRPTLFTGASPGRR